MVFFFSFVVGHILFSSVAKKDKLRYQKREGEPRIIIIITIIMKKEEVPEEKKLSLKKEETSSDEEDANTQELEWWEQENISFAQRGEKRWSTLSHNGVMFPPPYVPHGIPIMYAGELFYMNPEEEEVATMFAVLKESDYYRIPIFRQNFFRSWRRILDKRPQGHPIKRLELCDFEAIYNWHMSEREKKLSRTKEEKKAIKKKQDEETEQFRWCTWDGKREQVGNFRVEPPGLFRGRGQHPLQGSLKLRVQPEDITINVDENAPVPAPPEGHRWGSVIHDNTVTWLAMWRDSVGGNFKYVMLAPSSAVKGQSDMQKFEKARSLKNHIGRIRESYMKDFKSTDLHTAQRAVATYFIDKLALRVGNEKGSDEADTVGCCSLRVEHITLLPNHVVKFDFLGKDSIRYENEVEVIPEVYTLLQKFTHKKKKDDGLFDQVNPSHLNDHFKSFMDGLSAKVFRTYNASITMDKWFTENPVQKNGSVADKLAYFNKANTEVAVLCNHQKSVSKNFRSQMSQLTNKRNRTTAILSVLEEAQAVYEKKGADAAAKLFFEKVDQMQWEWLNTYGTEEERAAYAEIVKNRGAPKIRSSSKTHSKSKTGDGTSKRACKSKAEKGSSKGTKAKSNEKKKKSTTKGSASKKTAKKGEKTAAKASKSAGKKKSVLKEEGDSSDDNITLGEMASTLKKKSGSKGKVASGKKRPRDSDSDSDVPLLSLI